MSCGRGWSSRSATVSARWTALGHPLLPRLPACRPRTPLTQDDIDAQLDGVRAKFAALAERWRALAESRAHVLYVHHDAFDECAARDLRRLRHVIATAHPGQSLSLLWLRRTPPADAGDLPPGIAWGTVAAAPGRWEGDDAQWDEVFSAVQMSPDPLWPTPQPRRHPA